MLPCLPACAPTHRLHDKQRKGFAGNYHRCVDTVSYLQTYSLILSRELPLDHPSSSRVVARRVGSHRSSPTEELSRSWSNKTQQQRAAPGESDSHPSVSRRRMWSFRETFPAAFHSADARAPERKPVEAGKKCDPGKARRYAWRSVNVCPALKIFVDRSPAP